MIKLSELKINPGNPRLIKDTKFKLLVKSLMEFPEMMKLRPIVVNDENIILGGNMRYRALVELKYKEIPDEWFIKASNLTEDQQKEFLIKDNVGFGEWDYDILANEWETELLEDWGLNIPIFEEKKDPDEKPEKEDDADFFVPDCIYSSNNMYDIPTLKIENQATELLLPLKPYGADARTNGDVGTYHFYVDDYRFEAIWKSPVNILKSGCTQLVEPNLSLYDSTPISYGLFLIYKKRWLARFFQEKGYKVYADLNVSQKFYEYNAMGIPEGYNAFFTRGYTGRLPYLEMELEIARKISGKKEPNMVVYGGSKEVKEFCAKNNLIFVKDFINAKKETNG